MSIVTFEGSDGKKHYAFAHTAGEVEEAFYGGGYADGYTAGRAAGQAEGREAAEAECAAKHFSGIVTGDGSKTLSVAIPFEPDTIMVHCVDIATVVANSGTNSADYVLGCTINPKSTVAIGGAGFFAHKGGLSYQGSKPDKATFADGVVTISGLVFGSSLSYTGLFASGQKYVVTAEKHTE